MALPPVNRSHSEQHNQCCTPSSHRLQTFSFMRYCVKKKTQICHLYEITVGNSRSTLGGRAKSHNSRFNPNNRKIIEYHDLSKKSNRLIKPSPITYCNRKYEHLHVFMQFVAEAKWPAVELTVSIFSRGLW